MRIHHKATCLHCRRYSTIDARGLCCSCYHQPEIRDRYPSSRRYPADRELARRPQCRFPYSGEEICIDPGPQRGRPSHQDEGHVERLAAHAARVACEDPEMRRTAPADPAAYGDRGIAAVAGALGVAPQTVRAWVRSGRLRAALVPSQTGLAWRINPESLAEFVRSNNP